MTVVEFEMGSVFNWGLKTKVPLEQFWFEKYDYEVAFEFRTSSLLSRIFRHKEEHLVYYIRRNLKSADKPMKEEILSWRRSEFDFFDISYGFWQRGYTKPIYWHNPTDAENFLTRLYLKLKPSSDNVVFSTASLEGLGIIRKALEET